MGKGFAVVFVLALVALIGTIRIASSEEDDWIDERGDVAAENAGRLGTGQDLKDPPDAPLIVEHTALVAIGASLVVAVVGSILVLLFVIAVRRS